MPVKRGLPKSMTTKAFLAFADQRPNGERWEPRDGIAILKQPPTQQCQLIVRNIIVALMTYHRDPETDGLPLLGVYVTPPSANSVPLPNVIVKEGPLAGRIFSDEAVVQVDVISSTSTEQEIAWRREAYSRVPNCQHHVTFQPSNVSVTRYDRASDWKPFVIENIDDELELPALGMAIRLSEIYRDSPLMTNPGKQP